MSRRRGGKEGGAVCSSVLRSQRRGVLTAATFRLTPLSSDINATSFTLKWNTMPHVGALAYGDEARTGQLAVPKRIESAEPERLWF